MISFSPLLQVNLFSRIRLAKHFPVYEKRLQCIQARLQAISVLCKYMWCICLKKKIKQWEAYLVTFSSKPLPDVYFQWSVIYLWWAVIKLRLALWLLRVFLNSMCTFNSFPCMASISIVVQVTVSTKINVGSKQKCG